MKILAISGSLRKASHNTAVVATLEELAPDSVTIERAEIGDLPLYNDDLDADAVPAVVRLKAQIRDADAVIIATPEYNYGVPGPLKNAIDWASRPGYKSVFASKPVGILGASGSTIGTARAHQQLKTILLGMLAQPFPYPEVLVAQAHAKIDGGVVTDRGTRDFLSKFLHAFVAWAPKVPPVAW